MKHWRGFLVFLFTVSALGAQNVLTWNVGLLSIAGVDIVPAVAERSALIPSALARLAGEHDLDLIALQEVWNDADARAILGALEPLGYRSFRPAERAWTGVGSGLLVLWSARWTSVDERFGAWRQTAGWEGLSRKGWAHVTLNDRTGERLDALTFHLGAVDAPDGVVTDERQRSAWAQQFAQLAAEWNLVPTSARGAVLGDANVGPGYGQDQYELLNGLSGLTETALPSLATWDPTNPLVKAGAYPNEPPAWIDHVFLSPASAASPTVRVLDLGLSDHYAVLVTGPPRH